MSNAFTVATPFALTNDDVIDATTNGYKWYFAANQPRVLDWSVSSSKWAHPDLQSPETQEDFARAFSFIAEFIDVKFNFLGYIDGGSGGYGYQVAYNRGANLNISYSYNGTSSSGAYFADNLFGSSITATAFCFFPDSDFNSFYMGAAGDTWLNANNPFIRSLTYETGTNGFALLLHEVLHGLGLKHPHDDGGTGRPTYTSLGMKYADRQWISIMSYDKFDNGGDGAYTGSMPIGPMIFDAIALQYLYGESSFNSGDTNYDLTRYVGSYYNCQWDASGTDTLDGSNLGFGIVADLGYASQSNGHNTHMVGFITTAIDYLGLSLGNPEKWTWLWGEYENASGSRFGDILVGNLFDNAINGGDGDDYLTGREGNDTFDWAPSMRAGNDTLEGGPGDDIYVLDSSRDVVLENPSEGVDTVYAGFNYSLAGTYVENLSTFHDQQFGLVFTGNEWGNRITGGLGNDQLAGGSGADTLRGAGGNDTIDGGPGGDAAVFSDLSSNYSIRRIGPDSFILSSQGVDGSDTLTNIERLQFANSRLALDLAPNQAGGMTALMIGAVMGVSQLTNKSLVSAVLSIFDAGATMRQLSDALVNNGITAREAGGNDVRSFVGLVHNNVMGFAASEETKSILSQYIDSGAMTQGQFLAAVAALPVNQSHVNLIGLASTGLEYL